MAILLPMILILFLSLLSLKRLISEQSIEDGDKVLFELVNWSQRVIMPEAKILKILGKTHEPKAEFKAILMKYNLDPDFPKAVLNKLIRYPKQVKKSDIQNRLDLRNDYTFTIDPDDAKDFDDALSIKEINDEVVENCRSYCRCIRLCKTPNTARCRSTKSAATVPT